MPYLLDYAAVPPGISPVAFPALDEYSYGKGGGLRVRPTWGVVWAERMDLPQAHATR